MKEELISLKTYELAQETGFELTGFHTQSLLQKWLREVHNCHLYVQPYWNPEDTSDDAKPSYVCWVVYKDVEEEDEPKFFDSYEQALEDGLQEALIWVKEENYGNN